MDLQEVCRKNGLTDWDMKILEREGLIHLPVDGQFTDEEARRVEEVVLLRRVLLSYNDIRLLLQSPNRVNSVLSAHMRALRQDPGAPAAVLPVLDTLWRKPYRHVGELIDDLREHEDELYEVDIHYELRPAPSSAAAPAKEPSPQTERSLQRGKGLVIAIMVYIGLNLALSLVINVVACIVYQQMGGFLITMISQMVISLAVTVGGVALLYFFWRGVPWIRYFYAIVHGINAVGLVISFLYSIGYASAADVVQSILGAALSAVVFWLLLFQQDVKDFLYEQRCCR